MYQPQTGSLRIDGKDIRQLNPVELRHAIAYVPQKSEFFYGTIAQKLRFAKPQASMNDIVAAVKKVGLLDDIHQLPLGFETRLRDQSKSQLPASFQQRLSLARAYLKGAKILLLDEPSNTLDKAGEERLMESLARLRGEVTIIMISHKKSQLLQADRLLILNNGHLVANGKPSELFKPSRQELS